MITSFLASLFTLRVLPVQSSLLSFKFMSSFSFIVIHIFMSTHMCIYNIHYIHIQYIYMDARSAQCYVCVFPGLTIWHWIIS